MVHTRSLAVAASAFLLGDPRLAAGGSTELQSVLKNTHGSNDYGYPTDFTRVTIGEIYLSTLVGHDESSLTKDRTLESLYINPILDVLKLQNPSSPFVTTPTNNGVFDTSTSQTLYFFIDLKTSGPETLNAVISALQPLRDQGYLTTLKDNSTITTGPVTVIGTGNTPLDMVGPVADRDYFYDAPLEALAEPEYADITDLISPIASTNFAAAVGPVKGEKLSDKQIKALREQIQTAEERGIGARYWGTPYYPIRTRNFVWRTLLEEGVGLLNADDLDAVVEYF
ncbi:similar to An07g03410 [Aspergillus luchuensis IFO 4308]|nr:similar to An07g03410 [Aspergillus luchuensis IFO 4308]